MNSKRIPLWRKVQRKNFTQIDKLFHFLELSQEQKERVLKKPRFVLNLPLRLAEKIQKKTLEDPILKQFVPLIEEQEKKDGFTLDPVQDVCFQKESSLLQKYPKRALLLTTSACAMHCRYCFRQNFPYEKGNVDLKKEIEKIQKDTSLKEIILSGGDPLSLSDQELENLLNSLDQIEHIQRIRFHSRFIIGIPERVSKDFLKILQKVKKQIFFIIHINHPKELDEDVMLATQKMMALKIPVLSQSVLLKGVNDDPNVMLLLCEKLINTGILPYYLHAQDRVEGSSHFLASDEKGFEIIDFLQNNLSGFAVPKFVREIPNKSSKTILSVS